MNRRGFIALPVVLIAIAILAAGAGAFWYAKVKSPARPQTDSQQSAGPERPVPSPTSSVAGSADQMVPGMSKYIDADFGFAFWIPNNWTIKAIAVSNPGAYPGGTILKSLKLSGSRRSGTDEITIEEYNSPARTITTSGYWGTIRYYFDIDARAWMIEYPKGIVSEQDGSYINAPGAIVPVKDFKNTMGGLHIFPTLERHGVSVIIPLSAKNFLVIFSGYGGTQSNPLVQTILATDPSIATPVSLNEQKKITQREAVLFGAIGSCVDSPYCDWYKDSKNVYNHAGDIIPGANQATFRVINGYGTNEPSGYATDGTHVYASDTGLVDGADPATFVQIRQALQIPYSSSSDLYGKSFTVYESFARDVGHVWWYGKLIPGADPQTFTLIGKVGGVGAANDAKHAYEFDYVHNIVKIDGNAVQLH